MSNETNKLSYKIVQANNLLTPKLLEITKLQVRCLSPY